MHRDGKMDDTKINLYICSSVHQNRRFKKSILFSVILHVHIECPALMA